uniref:Gag-Pol polyprotein n=1 Tax=Tanacetum cinerariifolium TaxID=118510 RepID=A0A6L2K103_TANCI|nr:Gag-Pol polyprotein [Tanacetum cinerariifolium]
MVVLKRKSSVIDEHLEEKHMTWAHFRKKLDKNTTFKLATPILTHSSICLESGFLDVKCDFSMCGDGITRKNVNPFGPLVPRNAPRDQITQEPDELFEISAMIDYRLEKSNHDQIVVPPPASPEQLLHNFLDPPEFLEIDDIVSDAESVDTPLESLFLDSDNESDDGECKINHAAGGKLCDKNAEESWALIEYFALNDNESWNDPRDFVKPVNAISFPHDVPNTFDRHLTEHENQIQRLMEAHLAPKPSIQVNKITSSCEICSAPHDTQYCMKIPSKLLLIMHPRIPMKWKKAKIAVGERITRSIFRVKEINLGVEDVPYSSTLGKQESYEPRPSTDEIRARSPYYAKKNFMNYSFLEEEEIARDAKLTPFKDVLVFRKMTILLGLPEDIYVFVDSFETTQEIWLRVQQMMKGSDIGIQEKKAKLFNEWERFTSNDRESIESYYHRLMNDLNHNNHFPKKIASNLKFLNNLQPEWSRHVTIVHQTKDLYTADYTQLYDFLKYNQKEVDELKAERLAKTQDPLALMATSNNPYNFPAPHQDQPSFNQNYMQQPMPNPEYITDPATAMNMSLALMAKAFKLNYLTPTNNNQRISSNLRNRQIAQPGMNMGQDRQMQMVGGNANKNINGNGNLVAAHAEGNAAGHNGNKIRCYNCKGVGHFARNCSVRPRRRDAAYLQTQLLIAQKEEARIQLQAEEFDLMAAAADLDEIKEVNANCILIANLQQASTSGTQTDKALVYDSDESAEVHDYENCNDNEIFNMFTQEEKYTKLLEPIPESHQVPQNDSNVIYEVTSMEQSGETVEQHSENVEETHALYDSLYQNLAIKVEKVNTSVYQEQCLSKKINVLYLSSDKQIITLNEEILDLNKQLSKEKSTVSFLLEENKRLKSDFKTREDELLEKQVQLEKKIKELNNILVKTGQSIQTIHMLSPQPDSFYHTEQNMALGYQNPFYLKQAQKKQQSLYDGKVLLEKHDPRVVHDSEETLQLAKRVAKR